MSPAPARSGITIPFDGIPLHAHREWFARLRELGYTDLWSAEVDGADGFTPLALAAAWEPELNLGVAITPAYTRGPALLAQSLASMADAAPGPLRLRARRLVRGDRRQLERHGLREPVPPHARHAAVPQDGLQRREGDARTSRPSA